EQVVLLLVEAATGVRLTAQHDVERVDVGGGEAPRLQGGQDVYLREGVEGGGPMLLFATYQHHELVVDQVPLLAATHLLHLSAQDEMPRHGTGGLLFRLVLSGMLGRLELDA